MTDFSTSLIWVDVNGRTRQTILKSLAGAGIPAAALQACSLASILTSWQQAMQAQVGTQVSGTYQTVGDVANLVFQTSSGSIVRVTLPAPNAVIMLADRVTVDPTSPNVAAFIAAALGVLTDGSGNAVTSYIGGYYSRSKGTDLLTP